MILIYYNRNYIPFNLYINSLTSIFSNNHIDYKVITNIKEATDFDYLILFVNDAKDVMHIKDKKVIFIVADYFINHSKEFQEKFTEYVNINPNISVWEYNILNIEYYKQHFPNIKTRFIPLMYNKYLEDVYNVPRIEYKDKPIDVLFMGCESDRRIQLLKKIQGKYKFYFMTNVNDMNRYMNIIENSKITINIYSNEINKPFDYYRFALLLSNKSLILTEDYYSEDFENLSNLNIMTCTYENMIEKIDELLNKPTEEIAEIVEKTHTEYKKHDMEKYVVDFFKPSLPLPLFKVFMSEDVLEPLKKTVMSGFISQGEQVNLFEQRLTEFFGNENVLTLNSATSGLTLALRLLINPDHENNWPGIDKDDYVLSPALTCFATNVAILANHCKIKWLDTDNTTANVSIEDIKRKLSKHTKVLYLVHWGGYPVDLDALKELQEEHLVKYGYKFAIVEDCAHAFGAEYKNKKLGNHGNICVFSFQAIKHLTTGDGGLIILPKHLYERAKLLRWFGIDRDKRNYKKDFRLENDISEWGYKFHMNDLNAVIGLYNLPHMNGLLEKNRANYDYLYKNLKGVELLENNPDRKSACWLFTIKVDNKTEFIEKMKEKGIMTSQVHNRNDLHSCVSEFSCDLPNITELEKSLVCIPAGWWLEKRDLDYIIESVNNFISSFNLLYCSINLS